MSEDKIKIEIWSDIMCPFCFIGKRRFEKALDTFANKEEVEVVWKSFELYPDLETDTALGIKQFLIDQKGIAEDQAEQMIDAADSLANDVGLDYDWEKIVIANTKKAHELLHLAEKESLQNEMKEVLFRAYFEEGKNVDDLNTLIALGVSVGLNEDKIKLALENDRFVAAVNFDVNEARQLGVSGVPFFVLNRKYAVSGAQSEDYFLRALQTAHFDWKNPEEAAKLREEQQKGSSCAPGSGCC